MVVINHVLLSLNILLKHKIRLTFYSIGLVKKKWFLEVSSEGSQTYLIIRTMRPWISCKYPAFENMPLWLVFNVDILPFVLE